MNKEQIKEAEKRRKYKIVEALEYILNDKDLALGYCTLFEKISDEFLESKCEEIERKAYEEGVIEGKKRETSHYMSRFRLEINYDKWKESQNQEQ